MKIIGDYIIKNKKINKTAEDLKKKNYNIIRLRLKSLKIVK